MPGSEEMKPAGSGVKLTYDFLLQFPEDDGKRHELIDGEHYVSPTPNVRHQAIVGNLAYMIRHYLETQPIGRVFGVPLDIVFSDFDVVEPDVLYASNERFAEIATEANLKDAPELVVEVGSPSTRKRDETLKHRLYERFGVTEYWVVDPKRDAIRVFRRLNERYERTAELSVEHNDVLTTPLLPGLERPLAKIFQR